MSSLSLLSCLQKFLLDNMKGRRAHGHEGNLKVKDDLINDFMIFYHSGQRSGFTS